MQQILKIAIAVVLGAAVAIFVLPRVFNQPTEDATASFELVHQYPEIVKTTERIDDSILSVKYYMRNNVGREIDRFTFHYRAEGMATLIQTASSKVQPQAKFEINVSESPYEVGCLFELQNGQVIQQDERVLFECIFHSSLGNALRETTEIIPEPFDVDSNYNQIHDLLDNQIETATSPQARQEQVELIVMFRNPVTENYRNQFTSRGGRILGDLELLSGFSGVIALSEVLPFRQSLGDVITLIEPVFEVVPQLDVSTKITRANIAWDTLGIKGDPLTSIVILDSGLDGTHTALQSYEDVSSVGWSNLNPQTKVVGWKDFSDTASPTPIDDGRQGGHGSHVGGIAAGNDPRNPKFRGVAPNARLVGVKDNFVNGMYAELAWIVEHMKPFHIISFNQSMGMGNARYRSVSWEKHIEILVERGLVAVVSAGNNFRKEPGGIPISSPGREPLALTVGAVNDSIHVTDFSSNGRDREESCILCWELFSEPAKITGANLKPDVVAPGSFILSIDANVDEYMDLNGNKRHDGGDPCWDLNMNSEWDRSKDFFLDLDMDRKRDEWEPYEENNGNPGFQAGGDLCVDTSPSDGVISGDGAFSGELFFDTNESKIFGDGGSDGFDNYTHLSGTSMAAPHVAGEVALIIDAMTDYGQNDSDSDGSVDEEVWDGIDNDNDGIIDEDTGEWTYQKELALLIKSIILMNASEVPDGEVVSSKHPNGGAINSPHWIDGNRDIDWHRGEKDKVEGYGFVAIDAAIEAVTKEFCAYEEDEFGKNPDEKQVWARHLHLYKGKEYKVIVDVPSRADYDAYLYSGTFARDVPFGMSSSQFNRLGIPNGFGEPQIALRPDGSEIKSIRAGSLNEEMTFEVSQDGLYFLVVRRVVGHGKFSVRLITPENWTVMVYMPAELQGVNGLDPLAFDALSRMEMVGSGEELMKDYQVIAFVDYEGTNNANHDIYRRQGDTVILCIRKDHDLDKNQYSIIKQPYEIDNLDISVNSRTGSLRSEANMGDPDTLVQFTEWAIDHFPAEKYALILWGDGDGYGWKVDPLRAIGPGGDSQFDVRMANDARFDALELHELRGAMSIITTKAGVGSRFKPGTGRSNKFDLLGFDMGHMALIEVAHLFKDYVNVMVASEEQIPSAGWPYHHILNGLSRYADYWDAESFAQNIVHAYHEYYTQDNPVDFHTLSAIRLNATTERLQTDPGSYDFNRLLDIVSQFGSDLKVGVEDVQVKGIRDDNVQLVIKHEARERVEEMSDRNYIDLAHFAELIQNSRIPERHKSSALLITVALRVYNGVIIANEHGPAHANSYGLSIYFPRDQFLPEDNCDVLAQRGDGLKFRTCGFDNPMPAKRVYAKDFDIKLPKLFQDAESWVHPRAQTRSLTFPVSTYWDEFLHRYYKPVADACVTMLDTSNTATATSDRSCEPSLILFSGESALVLGDGSSDSDGGNRNDIPEHHGGPFAGPLHYYWDTDPTSGRRALGPDVVVDCEDDCDRDGVRETDDEPDVRGTSFTFKCPIDLSETTTYQFRLIIWDEHHDMKPIYTNDIAENEDVHYRHYNVDDDVTSITCLPLPVVKFADKSTVSPGEKVKYTLELRNFTEETRTFTASDPLPANLSLDEGFELSCSIGTCTYNESDHEIRWTAELEPTQRAILQYRVIVNSAGE